LAPDKLGFPEKGHPGLQSRTPKDPAIESREKRNRRKLLLSTSAK